MYHMSALESTPVEEIVRVNPMSDTTAVNHFHHIEFYCGDATNTYKRFLVGLGMELISKSDQSTGNTLHASYVLQSGEMNMIFTAPYSSTVGRNEAINDIQINSETGTLVSPKDFGDFNLPFPGFDKEKCSDFFNKHGFGVKCIAVEVSNVYESYEVMIKNGAISCVPATKIIDRDEALGSMDYAEIKLYGDVSLRLINSKNYKGQFLPNFKDIKSEKKRKFDYGVQKFDHIVGNLWTLQPTMQHIQNITGFHKFAEFTADVVGTVDSGLTSVVLANNNERVLLPLNEPTYGTKRKSQIQTYLEQNNGEGVQHMALFTPDIFTTMKQMREASEYGGFEFMDRQKDRYYDNLPKRLGDSLTEYQYKMVRELGLLADEDDQGVLLQVFTKPIGDRPTLFLEIIQRIGCLQEDGTQRGGCGGFGKGNFKDLFQSIEDYEKTLKI
mmetsp:Transcript_375/g.434  ORF Transcript_375/g.434 Transcript_375/m.434 type:complete len:441 (+) Transcript_375:292-1614(+)|eukprot:CAMPEP_0119033438 /NCGR_PEP_ID=MMETSP1177-20130426/475_1 /TAXON_ID=2985 /ORGANISM="Ochromonas sp, Strain CCMP1899" /LENGTH=440 /DNA_ID=CAMNT_0006990173 /DNA_START=192 /DNA_END=1514 /DNA_ORIENTATION=+